MVFPIGVKAMEMSDRSQPIVHEFDVHLVVISVFIIIVSFYVPFPLTFSNIKSR